MNKQDLITAIVTKGNGKITQASAEIALNTVTDQIVKAVANGETVTLVGFGGFKSAAREAREGRNPSTGAAIQIPAATLPKFTAGQAFKDAVNNAATKGKAKKK